MLDLVSELRQHAARDVARVLGDEEDADALGADELHDLLDLVQQCLRGALEQQMRLVKEEHHLRLFRVSHFRHDLKELGEQPEHEGGIDHRIVDQGGGIQDIDHATSLGVGGKPVVDVDSRLSEEKIRPAVLQRHQGAHDDADAGLADVSVDRTVLGSVLFDEIQHRPQILEIQEKKLFIVRDPEHDVQKVALGLVQFQNTREQERTEFRDCRAERKALFPEDIPEGRRIRVIVEARLGKAEFLNTLLHVFAVDAGTAHSCEIALYVRKEHGDAGVGEGLRQDLQGDGFSGAGRACDQSVPVSHLCQDLTSLLAAFRDPDLVFRIHTFPPACGSVLRGGTLKLFQNLYRNSLTQGRHKKKRPAARHQPVTGLMSER